MPAVWNTENFSRERLLSLEPLRENKCNVSSLISGVDQGVPPNAENPIVNYTVSKKDNSKEINLTKRVSPNGLSHHHWKKSSCTAFPVGNENRRKIMCIYLDENILNFKNHRKEWIGQRSIERH